MNTDSKATSNKPAIRPTKDRKIWILYVGIALFIALWTSWGALFFLTVVWVMRKDPSPDASFAIGNHEKITARRVYTWLFISPVLTIPLLIVMLFSLRYPEATTNERILTTLVPLIFQAPLVAGLTSKSAFVYRHTQQGVLLVALRTGMAAWAISLGEYPYDGLSLFLLGNGALWLFGSLWGWNQIRQGQCWWMTQKEQKFASEENSKIDTPHMDQELDMMLKSLNMKDRLAAKDKALHAFRTESPESKQRALEVLSSLGEVEEF
jgi:hypothetical protein